MASGNDFSKSFQSERLSYTGIDASNQDFKDFAPQLMFDPSVRAMSDISILKPKGPGVVDRMIDGMSDALLAVAICLLPAEKARLDDLTYGVQSADGSRCDGDSDGVDKLLKPTIIGQLIFGGGGTKQDKMQHRNASIGISIATAFQNRGYGREAINWCLDWAFTEAGMHTVSISTASLNDRAAYLYADMGFVLEGRRRETLWRDRRWHDELLFSMTESEWEALRGFGNPLQCE